MKTNCQAFRHSLAVLLLVIEMAIVATIVVGVTQVSSSPTIDVSALPCGR